MSERKSHKRHHNDGSSHKKSKKSKSSHNESNKSNELIDKPKKVAVFTEPDPNEFQDELDKRREYIRLFQEKQSGETIDDRSTNCPYLDTINRSVLDFDFEKFCSISLTHLNVYACLVCGLYFQGRGTNTHAHIHSLDNDHHVFLNLSTRGFYCLPDNYEIIDSSLEDIAYLLNPTFTKKQIKQLDRNRLVRAYNGSSYFPGFVGLNNIKANDYCNVIIQLLSHVRPIRNFFLKESNYAAINRSVSNQNTVLVQRFGELIRKLWNPRNFKKHVSPHELLQAVVLCSKKRFEFTLQGNSIDFYTWITNTLHLTLKNYQQSNKTIFAKIFRGKMKIFTRKLIPATATKAEYQACLKNPDYQTTIEESKFFMLTCDLPQAPLFKKEVESQGIPQIDLDSLLSKFNGIREKEYQQVGGPVVKRFQLEKLPPYLVICYKRFTKNRFQQEKNPTIVNFPFSSDFGNLLSEECRAKHKHTTYDLISNVSYDGSIERGTYKINIFNNSTENWYSIQDLDVKDIPEMLTLCETIIQVWKVNRKIPNSFSTMPPPPPPPMKSN